MRRNKDEKVGHTSDGTGYGSLAACMNIYLGVPFIAALFLGGLAAALSSLIVGYPTLKNKLTGDILPSPCWNLASRA